MPCTFKNGQEVIGNVTGRNHIITNMKTKTRKVPAGWGHATVEDTFVQVDEESTWYGWGNFKALSE